ncbi:MAG: malto-oligosyltrehalose synthase, partial [Pseudomonadota bacterium]|nr:malto-oligosyltrehalose synthase [Pseudomonadota bacterium]
YLEKAVRENKSITEWTRVDEAYEAALHAFIVHTMADEEFMRDVESFVARVQLPSRLNSLTQVCIKLTAPGVPDIYQGCELWDLSLVDPDNRRPVDFAHRAKLLDELQQLTPEQILARMDEGLPKLWLIQTALHFRGERPDLLGSDADYVPLKAEGARAGHAVAFVRGGGAAVIVPRLTAQILDGTRLDFGDTHISLPAGGWRSRFERERRFSGSVPLNELLRTVPFALLEKE